MATQVGVGWRGALQQAEQKGISRTRDLLGGNLSKEIDIDLDVDVDVEPQMISLPFSNWEKRLDMKSGKVFFHNCNSKESAAQYVGVGVRDLNFPPSPLSCPAGDSAAMKEGSPKLCESEWFSRVAESAQNTAVVPLEELNFMGKARSVNENVISTTAVLESNEVKLNLNLSNHEGASEWQSVCTLDKVKMALKRAEKDCGKRKKSTPSQIDFGQSSSWGKTRSTDRSPSLSSSSCSSLGLSLHNSGDCEEESEGDKSSTAAALQAAGCPRCLVYVLLPKSNPKCPRCGGLILLTNDSASFKRPRLHTHIHTDREEAQSRGASKAASSLPFDLNSFL